MNTEAMAERGVDITAGYPEQWTDEVVRASDIVITIAAATPAPPSPAGARGMGPRRTHPRRPAHRDTIELVPTPT